FHIFFFSSRRRHTIFSRDWSSDVCSSDLKIAKQVQVREANGCCQRRVASVLLHPAPPGALQQHRREAICHRPFRRRQLRLPVLRSEERRVGKECTSWWSSEHSQKEQLSKM